VRALAVLHDGALVSASCDKTVRIWDVKSGACLMTITEEYSALALAVLPNGELAVAFGPCVKIFE
jgi:WD40 repeat protein